MIQINQHLGYSIIIISIIMNEANLSQCLLSNRHSFLQSELEIIDWIREIRRFICFQ